MYTPWRAPSTLTLLVPAVLSLVALAVAGARGATPRPGGGAAAGGQLVFLTDRPPGLGSFAVAVMDGDGSGQRLLTHPDPRAIDPVWLPGGKEIAFKSVASPGDREVYGGVWLVRPDGSHLRWLLREPVSRSSTDPAWSADGKRMAFVRSNSLYLARPDGSRARRVFQSTRPLARPAWAPGGGRLAVSNGSSILVLALGPGRARLLFRTHAPLNAYAPSWSPDGRTIAYIGLPRSGVGGLYAVDEKGGHGRRLASGVELAFLGTAPSWSPDSRRIVVGRATGTGQTAGIAVVDVKSGRSRTIVRNGSIPQWSPSGRSIAFTAYDSAGRGGIYLVRPDGSRRRPLVPFGGAARFSPNGKRLAILAASGSGVGIFGVGGAIFVLDADGTHLRQLTHPIDDVAAVGSPDHRQIAFVRSTPADPRSGARASRIVYVMNGDGSGVRRIGAGDSVAWAPDSARVTFVRDGDIFAAPSDGGTTLQLTSGPETDSAPAWSPDGSRIAFTRVFAGSTRDVCLVDASSPGAPNCLSTGGGGGPAWSPDGTLLAFAIVAGAGPASTAIGVIRPDGSSRRLLAEGYAPAWAPDGQRIAFIDLSQSPDGLLAVIGLDGGGLTRLDRPAAPGPPSWSPDGSRIASASFPGVLYDSEIWAVAPDGSAARALTSNNVDDIAPTWWR